MRTIQPSPLLYSYAMNNYWHTNYKADQEGPVNFYAIQLGTRHSRQSPRPVSAGAREATR